MSRTPYSGLWDQGWGLFGYGEWSSERGYSLAPDGSCWHRYGEPTANIPPLIELNMRVGDLWGAAADPTARDWLAMQLEAAEAEAALQESAGGVPQHIAGSYSGIWQQASRIGMAGARNPYHGKRSGR